LKNRNPLNLLTEKIDLPSKGKLYPLDSPLSQGFVEILYPTAKEEDILTNPNYIKNDTAIDKFIESIMVTDIDINDLCLCDKDAVMVAGRILGLGSDYTIREGLSNPITFNLSELQDKEVDWSLFDNTNEFEYNIKDVVIKFKVPTGHDMIAMKKEVEGLKKIDPNATIDTRIIYKFTIVEVNGKRDLPTINDFCNRILMVDSKKLKAYVDLVTPGYTWKGTGTYIKDNKQEKVEGLTIPVTTTFFYPS